MLGVTDPHLSITNPIAPERSVMRRSLLASVLDDLERNAVGARVWHSMRSARCSNCGLGSAT